MKNRSCFIQKLEAMAISTNFGGRGGFVITTILHIMTKYSFFSNMIKMTLIDFSEVLSTSITCAEAVLITNIFQKDLKPILMMNKQQTDKP